VASDVITLACLPNGLLASSSGDSTIQLWDPASHDAARRRFSTRYLRRATLEDADLHEADKPDI
jgi:WD40 repeat protein